MENQIYTCLWFDGNAKEAAEFYCSIFKNSKIISDNSLVVRFILNGKEFMGLNGGPKFKFNESISFVINCENQQEIDYYWNELSKDGREDMCGWVKDKFGLSWQIVPTVLEKLMSNAEKAPKVMQAFLKMKKFDIQTLLSV